MDEMTWAMASGVALGALISAASVVAVLWVGPLGGLAVALGSMTAVLAYAAYDLSKIG